MSGWSNIRSGVDGQRDTLIESLKSPDEMQRQLLRQIIDRNRDCEFGERYDFRSIRTIEEYQQRVPLHDYDDFRADIDRMIAGEKKVLVTDDVLLFETTGGSTGGSKSLPFTDAGFKAIRRAVLPWLDDLVTTRPGITEGKAYWAISPATRQQAQTSGGIPIGITNDAVYFGTKLAQSIASTLAVPPSVASIQSFSKWQLETIGHLLRCRELSFVSVWSPTFFLQLLDAVSDNVELIANNVDPSRAAELREAFSEESIQWQRLWPKLDTISCWCSSSSRRYANELAERFPETNIQGKGLLATEGVVTVPLTDAGAAVLTVGSAFYEFEAENGDIVLPWDLETDQHYTVLLTTEAGLYRYRLGDRVLVVGWYEATPCLEFVGRHGRSSDLCGEKLTEEFVESALRDISGFGFLVPLAKPRPAYLLILDATMVNADQGKTAARIADSKLMNNPQYRYARELGQLPPVEPYRITDPLSVYNSICIQSGQRLGDIKPAALASAAWGELFGKGMAR